MSADRVRLSIDGVAVDVPAGTLLVDAAKMAGLDIPVFCYHPKLKPVGMCRMCLVEIGRPARDRASGAPVLDEQGQPVMQFGPNLETACTTPVGEGWAVRFISDKALEGRRWILEHLLTSHPLDCPVCDKGGECPLQNLTMAHGPGQSRFLFEEKQHLAKRVPLGDLIWLDRERCIQCARCTRFQAEIAGDPVIGLSERGRKLEIVTYSDPGFDSYFSGNTTDICPVGALTTEDFRFGARPWELNAAASICPHCPVGCNLTLNTRREALSGGETVIKRVMPRQNEGVNEIWICDKGRFAHHYARSPQRLTQPLVREGTELRPATWEQALARAAEGLKAAGSGTVGLAGGRLSNEDLFNFRQLVQSLGGRALLSSDMAGGDLVQQFGLGSAGNLKDLGAGDAILVIASDLHEEAPIWWLRIKQAAERGAALVVAQARPTRLDKHAAHQLRYTMGEAVTAARGLLGEGSGASESAAIGAPAFKAAAQVLAQSRNLVIFYGQEGLDYAGTHALVQICARLLQTTGHAGKPNSGLVPVWGSGNVQGAWDVGLRPPAEGIAAALSGAGALYLVGADPVGDDPALAETVRAAKTVVVQELFLTPTAQLADVVLPAQSFVERQGSFTTGERRAQRFYPALPPRGETRPDWQITADLGRQLGIGLESRSAASVFAALAAEAPGYAGLDYSRLALVEPQWPRIGGSDLYYGGTGYTNHQGLGVKLASAAEAGQAGDVQIEPAGKPAGKGELLLIPVTRLFDRGLTVAQSDLLSSRLAPRQILLHPEDAGERGLGEMAEVELAWDGRSERIQLRLHAGVPRGSALLPRSLGLPLTSPTPVRLTAAKAEAAS
jgi:NADH-quinone oxidoreductase subunit G